MEANALSAILAELRVSGAIVLSQAHPIPWSIRVPAGNKLRQYLEVGDDVTVVPFHIAHRGHFDLYPEDGAPVVVEANQLVMCANGRGHVMGSGDAASTSAFEDVMRLGSYESASSGIGCTEVVCGVFLMRNSRHNPLIAALPKLVKVDVSGNASTATMQKLHGMLMDELSLSRQAQSYMLERVLEMLYAESIRLYAEAAGDNQPNWLTAINDHRIGSAINYIHSHLGESMTIESLADFVALSPSRFSARFRELTGITPKQYISTQRQALASRLLRESRLAIQEVADRCGYQSIPSFNKAFVKMYGCPPSQWRRQQLEPER